LLVGLVVVLLLGASVVLGVLPGSAAVGRYPVWELHDLAERIDDANRQYLTPCPLGESRAQVDLISGRIEVGLVHILLTAEERAMLAHPERAPVKAMPEYDNFGGPDC